MPEVQEPTKAGAADQSAQLSPLQSMEVLQQALAESQQRFHEVAEAVPGAVVEMDYTGRITWVSVRGLRTFGYTQEEVDAGLSVMSFFAPEDRAELLQDITNVMCGDFSNPKEYRIRRKDGSGGHFLVHGAPIIRDGRPVGVRSCLVDITERYRMQEQLRLSEERFRTVFMNSPIGIALASLDGRLVDANDAFFATLRASRETATVSFDLLKHLQIAPSQTQTMKKNEVLRMETEYHTQDSATVYLDWQITGLGATGQQASILLVHVQDITGQLLARNLELQQVRQAKQQADNLVDDLKKEITRKSIGERIVSCSPIMMNILGMLPEMAQAQATVLITGESGTGKELFAHALHELGPRAAKPFIAINCNNLPENLLESELFGYKAGAFTDAKKDKPGKFLLADGGTLFLDEFGDISPVIQGKLLRVLQERSYVPLGDNKPVKVDVRVIAATNRNLVELIQQGKFREDLYYRIKVLEIHVPALRDRLCDIPLLTQHFVALFNRRYDKNIRGVSDEVLDLLMSHDYPGNVREMENILEHAFVFCKGGFIERSHLSSTILNRSRMDGPATGAAPAPASPDDRSIDNMEKQHILQVIKSTGGNKAEAARLLGMHKTTLFRKLKRYGLPEE